MATHGVVCGEKYVYVVYLNINRGMSCEMGDSKYSDPELDS